MLETRHIPGKLFVGVALLASLLFAIVAPPASASDIRSGATVVVEADEVIDDDLIVNGETIQIDGTVRGDLVATGSTIIVNGTVNGSAALSGQSVVLAGNVDGSVYGGSFAMAVTESAEVGRNLYYAGFSLDLAADSQIGRSVYVAANQVVANGGIGGDLVVGSAALELSGTVGGDVRGEVAADDTSMMPINIFPNMPVVEPVAPGLRVDPGAVVGGTVAVEQVAASDVRAEDQTGFLGLPDWFTNRLGEFIGLLLIGALMAFLAPRFVPAIADEMRERPWPSLGWGALALLVLFPVGIVAGGLLIVLLTAFFGVITFGELTGAILTLSGSFMTFLFFDFLFVAYVIAKIIVGYFIGRLLLGRTSMDPASPWTHIAYIALGVLIFELLRAIPVLGWMLSLLVTLFGLGAIISYWLTRRRDSGVAAKLEAVS